MKRNKIQAEVIEKNISEIEKVSANAVRTQLDKDEIILDFGQLLNKGDLMEVTIVSRISIRPSLLKQITARLIMAGIKYQEYYNEDIGFSKIDKKDK